jgi:hypothetical protein
VEKESANKALGFLARALDDDFVNAYCQAQADPEAKRYQELVEPIGEIISEFVRLGMQEHAAILRAHLERSIDGDLSAFLLADSQGLLVLRNFHAGHWHTDSTSDGYERRWTGALDVLEKIAALPNSAGVFGRVHSNLSQCATQARGEIQDKLTAAASEPSPYWEQHGPGMLAVLNNVDVALAIMRTQG